MNADANAKPKADTLFYAWMMNIAMREVAVNMKKAFVLLACLLACSAFVSAVGLILNAQSFLNSNLAIWKNWPKRKANCFGVVFC